MVVRCCPCTTTTTTTTTTTPSTTPPHSTTTTPLRDTTASPLRLYCNLATFQQTDVLCILAHVLALVFLFGGFSIGLGSATTVPIPPVWLHGNIEVWDHLRFNLQWTVVIWSLYLYPAIVSDLLPVALHGKKTGQDNKSKGYPKWLRQITKSDSTIRSLGLINAILGFTTIGSYIYQTYEHDGNDWFGSDPYVRKVTNVTLCVVDTAIDLLALGSVAVALTYVPLAHQRLAYLTSTDTMFLTLGASSNLVYCLQIFYEFIYSTGAVPDPHTLTFFRIFPIVSFVNYIATKYLVTSKELWRVYEVYLKLIATCIVVAGLMVTTVRRACGVGVWCAFVSYVLFFLFSLFLGGSFVDDHAQQERIGNPSLWDPGEDGEFDFGWTFFKSLWFVVVTVSTVGYGDFSTSTFFGRVITIVVIFTGLPKFTQYAGQMWELLRERR